MIQHSFKESSSQFSQFESRSSNSNFPPFLCVTFTFFYSCDFVISIEMSYQLRFVYHLKRKRLLRKLVE